MTRGEDYMAAEDAIASVDAIVASGKAIISGDDSSIIAMVQEAIRSGRTMTFYVSRKQGLAIFRLYWTPRRIVETRLKRVPDEEKAKIERELDIKEAKDLYSNYLECPNGHIYGAYEFFQQGIREHGKEFVKSALELKNTSIVRVNPIFWAVCPICKLMIVGGHYYYWNHGAYGCCSGEIP